MIGGVRVVVNRREVARLKHHPKVQEAVENGADLVVDMAQRFAPEDTGGGAASIHAEQDEDGSWHVSWDEEHYYMKFPEFGTERQPPQAFLRGAAAVFQ